MARSLYLAALTQAAWAKTVFYNFDIGWVSAAPDGYVRPVIGINGQWPIPTIEANVHDTIVVHARNSLGNESTSLHFHGLFQYGSAAYDGPVGVTRCPINPGQSFTYKFKAYPAGTHWYHSHDKGQYPDGLRGKMIIHDPKWEASLDIDEQVPLSMSDWYHTQMPYFIHDYLSPDNTDGDIPSPDAFLFNDTTKAPEFKFEPNKRYLLRIVSTSALACGAFHIDGHILTVVAVDGAEVHPKDTETIIVCAGQSYDVIVTGKSDPSANVQYIAKMMTDMLTGNIPNEDKISVIGNLTYMENDFSTLINTSSKDLSPGWIPSLVLDDTTLRPLDNQRLLRNPTKRISFQMNQTYYEDIGTRIALGVEPWTEPKVPTLYTALSTGRNALVAATYGPGVAPEILRSNEVTQIYMENPQPWPHPMHLHGHIFQVAGRGVGSWDGTDASLHAVPMKRDNVVIPPNGYLVLRFTAWNPGVWFFHCHIDFHLVGGMAAAIIEAPEVLQRQQLIPPSGAGLCRTSGQSAQGNCACGRGEISAAEAEDKCNSIFNTGGKDELYGALITH